MRGGLRTCFNYSPEGDFISKIALDSLRTHAFTFINDTLLLIEDTANKDGYRYHVLNLSTRQIQHSFYPMKYRRHYTMLEDCMTTYNGKILISQYQSNQIMEVTKDSASVRFTLNINDRMPPEGYWEKPTSDLFDYRDKGYIGDIECYAEGKEKMLFRFRGIGSDRCGFALVEKATGNHVVFDELTLAEGFTVKPKYFQSLDNGKLCFVIDPMEILECGNQEFIARFPGLVEDSNPVLLEIELE